MGLLFQPRWSADRPRRLRSAAHGDVPFDRGVVFLTALEAVVLGDASRFSELFTEDVVFSSPHLVVESLAAVQHALGAPEDSLTDVADRRARRSIPSSDKVIAEWRLDAMFTRPVLFDDRLLIEPTGGDVHLPGASVAEFRRASDPRVPSLLRRQRAARRRARHAEPPAVVVRR